jgi:hypothetical protein
MSPLCDSHVYKVVLRLCEDVASPVSVKVAILLRYEEWDQLVSQKLDPLHYLEPEQFWRDSLVVGLLRKLEDLPTSFDRKAAAEENFLLSERQCRRSNDRLFPYLSPDLFWDRTDKHVLRVLTRARKIIADMLGPCPDVIDGRFGPGATYGDRGRFTTIPDKMSSSPTLTSSAWAYQVPWSATQWAKACASEGRETTYVPGNRFTTVPKDAEKHRGIAIEPSLNLFYQLGYGRVIRSRIKSAGIDLSSSHMLHRQVACEASKDGSYATIELSIAGDSGCTNRV